MYFDSDPNCHYLLLIVDVEGAFILLANIYGYNSKEENDNLLVVIEACFLLWLSKYPNLLLIVGGDFNTVPDPFLDRWPPSTNPSLSVCINAFMEKFNFIDIGRVKNPNLILYTWNNSSSSTRSRIDFWLIPDLLNKNIITVDTLPTPFTDHNAISLQISFRPNIVRAYRSCYWKRNNSLLNHENVIKKCIYYLNTIGIKLYLIITTVKTGNYLNKRLQLFNGETKGKGGAGGDN